jgi:hypothetical protein
MATKRDLAEPDALDEESLGDLIDEQARYLVKTNAPAELKEGLQRIYELTVPGGEADHDATSRADMRSAKTREASGLSTRNPHQPKRHDAKRPAAGTKWASGILLKRRTAARLPTPDETEAARRLLLAAAELWRVPEPGESDKRTLERIRAGEVVELRTLVEPILALLANAKARPAIVGRAKAIRAALEALEGSDREPWEALLEELYQADAWRKEWARQAKEHGLPHEDPPSPWRRQNGAEILDQLQRAGLKVPARLRGKAVETIEAKRDLVGLSPGGRYGGKSARVAAAEMASALRSLKSSG